VRGREVAQRVRSVHPWVVGVWGVGAWGVGWGVCAVGWGCVAKGVGRTSVKWGGDIFVLCFMITNEQEMKSTTEGMGKGSKPCPSMRWGKRCGVNRVHVFRIGWVEGV